MIGVAALAAAPVTLAGLPFRTITTAGATLRVPAGWHAVVAATPTCDPERLIVVSSAPLRVGSDGQLARPGKGQVLLLLLEDRSRQDRPEGDLQRPAHFSIRWNRLVSVKSICGNPSAPAFMRYIKTHGRYIGFSVYPGSPIASHTRAMTLAVMDSLRVTS
ncbi:MAG: hypothetical protein ACYDCH_04595 [Gaiellaceae bacterium]